ncbi:uncharacterized protein TNCV_1223271 [Trichonephila clavipes]|nr:uncharacterized protein TNCV_1223271 [Trichonephila clavipes]
MSQLRVDSLPCLSEPILVDKIDASKRGCGSLAVKVSSWEFMLHVNADATPANKKEKPNRSIFRITSLNKLLSRRKSRRMDIGKCT